MQPAAPTAADLAEVRDSARAYDLDRYLAALLAPRAVRDDLVTLAATLGEIARVPGLVKEPMMGEMRLTWWRDELTKPVDAEPSGHPVADAMRRIIARHDLPTELIEGLTEARVHDLYADAVKSQEDLDAYLDMTEGAGFRLAARIVGASDADPALTSAGRAFGLARLLIGLPRQLARGRDPLPVVVGMAPQEKTSVAIARAAHDLHEARRMRSETGRKLMPALLPLALVEPYLRALQKAGHNPWTTITDISPLTRVWRLWRAHVSGRI